MIYPVANERRGVTAVSSVSYPQFGQTANRRHDGAWLLSYPTPYEQYARKAASRITDILNAIRQLQASADAVTQLFADKAARPEEQDILGPVRRMVGAYNTVQELLDEARIYVSSEIAVRFERAVRSFEYEQLGISLSQNGLLLFNELRFKQALDSRYERTSSALAQGLAASLAREARRLNEAPASHMLNKKLQALQQLAAYQSTMDASWQLPSAGILLNNRI